MTDETPAAATEATPEMLAEGHAILDGLAGALRDEGNWFARKRSLLALLESFEAVVDRQVRAEGGLPDPLTIRMRYDGPLE